MKYFFVIINLVLISLAVYFCVDGVYTCLGVRLTSFQQIVPIYDDTAPNKENIPMPIHNRNWYEKIITRNLFKVKLLDANPLLKKIEVTDQALDLMEKTHLDLKLWGTVSSPAINAFAVIEEKKKRKQDLYKRGDTIQGATIKTILRHRVVLTFQGKDQILEMNLKDRKSAKALPKRSVSQKRKKERVTIDRATINESVSDLSNLMKQVRIRPHFSGGKPDGLLLYGIKPKSLFREMGLKNGDIIMGVDGKNIKSVDDALSLYQNLKNAENVNLSIKRHGTIKEFDYHVQ